MRRVAGAEREDAMPSCHDLKFPVQDHGSKGSMAICHSWQSLMGVSQLKADDCSLQHRRFV